MVDKWAGSIEIGVTTHSPLELDFPSTMTNLRYGTWMMTGNGVMHNGTTVIDEYGQNLDRLKVKHILSLVCYAFLCFTFMRILFTKYVIKIEFDNGAGKLLLYCKFSDKGTGNRDKETPWCKDFPPCDNFLQNDPGTFIGLFTGFIEYLKLIMLFLCHRSLDIFIENVFCI